MPLNLGLPNIPYDYTEAVVANQGRSCLSGDAWPCLETFLVVTRLGVGQVVVMLLASSG